MPGVISVGTALPQYRCTASDIVDIGTSWLQAHPEQLSLFLRFLSSSRCKNRYFILSPPEILSLGGLLNRADIFERFAAPLGAQSIRAALTDQEYCLNQLKTLIFTSCTCPSIPSVDGLIIDELELDRGINRIPIFQHGCAGGVVGLRMAADLSKVHGTVCLTSVELCSLVFQRQNIAPAQLVGAALFADGAASALVVPEDRGLAIRATRSFLVPRSRHLMGYDFFDDGFHLRLDKNLPHALIEAAPHQITSFLAAHGLNKKDIAFWLFHPGGTKILDFLEQDLSLQPHQSYWAREVLSTVGNLSSATVLFVLRNFLESKVYVTGDRIVMVGVGPGLTLEMILFEWVS